MKLQVPFIQLPLLFDAGALAAEVAAIGEDAWKPHPQGFPGNSMLPLLAVEGDPDDEAFSGAMRPTPWLAQCPGLSQVLASLQATIGRTRLMRLAGDSEVVRHADQGYYWVERVRVHVPLVTQPTVRFECGDAVVNMGAGECWIFDTWRQHRVLNDAREARIHLVVDTVGGAGFWDLVSRGRPHPGPAAAPFQPMRVDLQPGRADSFACEAVNVAAVMNPWELEQHLRFLFEESLPNPALGELQRSAARMLREWRGLWFAHGDRGGEDARERYRAAFEGLLKRARQSGGQVTLRNGMPWLEVLEVMLGRTVVGVPTSADAPDRAGQHKLRGDNA